VSYAITATMPVGFDEALAATRQALADNGFGIVSEIDIRATLKAKIDVDVPDHTILGACRPALAHRALQAEPSIGLLLPCNVVVRAADGGTVVEAIDPATMVTMTGNPALQEVADEVRERLVATVAALAA
jgi:uncharacterized protein (DUF302 family)